MAGVFKNILSMVNEIYARVERRAAADQRQQIANYVNPLKKQLMTLQSLLVWKDSRKSSFFLVAFSVFYWTLYIWPISILTSLSTVCLIFYVHHHWVTVIWPEISVPSEKKSDEPDFDQSELMSTDEIVLHIEKCWKVTECKCHNFLRFRKNNPAKFCAVMVGVFSCTLIIGIYVPGVILLYTLCMTLLLSPGVYMHRHQISSKIPACVQSIFQRKGSTPSNCDQEFAEFLPEEISEEVQEALHIPFNQNKLNDSSFNSYFKDSYGISKLLAFRNDEMPSINDPMLDEDPHSPLEPSRTPPDIEFTSGHFAESSDEDFTEGLAFSPREEPKVPVRDSSPVQSTSDDSLDDEEFEIIEPGAYRDD